MVHERRGRMLDRIASRKLCKVYRLPDDIMVINLRRGDACSTCGGNDNYTKILIRKSQGNRPLGGLRVTFGLDVKTEFYALNIGIKVNYI
jgi:hypothetical protein